MVCAVIQVWNTNKKQHLENLLITSKTKQAAWPRVVVKLMSKLTLIAEEPTPSLLAVTLPGLLAGAMEAAWVTDTVVTVTATKANTAPGNNFVSNCS